MAKLADQLANKTLPQIKKAIASWRRKTLILDGLFFGTIAVLVGVAVVQFNLMSQPLSQWPILGWLSSSLVNTLISIGAILAVSLGVHYYIRHKVCKREVKRWQALAYNNRFWRGMFSKTPRGWGRRAFKGMDLIQSKSKQLIQKLNDQFADPSGQLSEAAKKEVLVNTKSEEQPTTTTTSQLKEVAEQEVVSSEK